MRTWHLQVQMEAAISLQEQQLYLNSFLSDSLLAAQMLDDHVELDRHSAVRQSSLS